MEGVHRDRLFVALTRPQMFAGVTYSWFVINVIVAAELFLIFRSVLALFAALVLHGIGMILSIDDPRWVDLWLIRARLCGRVPNHMLWRCNSYRP